MEINVEIWINIFLQYKKRFLIIKDYIFSIYEYVEKNENVLNKEKFYHVKYLRIKKKDKENVIKIEIKNLKNEYIYIKTETIDDCDNLVNVIKMEKLKYENFLDEYFINNNTDRLLIRNNKENHSILQYLNDIKIFTKDIEIIVSKLEIEPNLENILNLQNDFIFNIDTNIKEIENFHLKLNSINNNEYVCVSKTKELKLLFEELRDLIFKCTYGLNSEDINNYIDNFKHILQIKIQDTNLIINEIKYLLKNYFYILLNNLNFDYENYEELSNSNENDIIAVKKLIFENEILKINIEEIDKENEIIENLLIEYMN